MEGLDDSKAKAGADVWGKCQRRDWVRGGGIEGVEGMEGEGRKRDRKKSRINSTMDEDTHEECGKGEIAVAKESILAVLYLESLESAVEAK